MSPAILVASPRQIGSMPVASGSRAPAWPAFSPLKSHRTRCRAAFEESPSGLSSSRIPLGIGVASVVAVRGAIGGDRAVDEAGEAGGALGAVIEQELEARGVPEREPPAELAAQEARGVSQSLAHLLGRLTRGERGEIDARRSHVGCDVHGRDRDVTDTRVLDLARDER